MTVPDHATKQQHWQRFSDPLDRALQRQRATMGGSTSANQPYRRPAGRLADVEGAFLRGESGQFALPRDRAVSPSELAPGREGGTEATATRGTGARSGQVESAPADTTGTDAPLSAVEELAEVVLGWPSLSRLARATILKVVRAAGGLRHWGVGCRDRG